MTDRIAPIRDLRFEGMDIPQLLEWIHQIKQGRGSESMHGAVHGLESAVQVVVDLDNTLRTELGKLQIAWEGNAGSLAQEATQHQTAVMQESQDPLKASGASVQAQGEGYDSAKSSLPNPDELRHQQSENFFEWAGGGFGYESDYDAEAKQIDAQRKAAQAALGSYRDTTVTQADAYQPLPEMRPASVNAQSAAPGSTPDVGAGGSGVSGGGSGADGGGSAVGGGPGHQGSGHEGSGHQGGGHSGVGEDHGGAGKGGGADSNPHDNASKDDGIGVGGMLGIGAGGAAVAGLGALAAGRLLGGKGKGGAGGARGGGSSPGAKPGSPGKGGSSGVGGGPGDTTAGRTASASATSRPAPGSLMGPAATRGAGGAEDEDHENKYVLEETPFDDNRLVAPAVFGHSSDEDAAEDEPASEDENADENERD